MSTTPTDKQSRRLFVSGFAFTGLAALAACAGGQSSLVAAGTGKANITGSDIYCDPANPCGKPSPTVPPYSTAAFGNGRYSHTLSWTYTDPTRFTPTGPVRDAQNNLITTASHSFAVNNDGSIVHAASLTGYGSQTRTTPNLTGPATYSAFGQTMTVQSATRGTVTWTAAGVTWTITINLTGTRTGTVQITSNQGYNLTEAYTLPSNFQPANAQPSSNLRKPDAIHLSTWGAVGMWLDSAGFIMDVIGAPELGLPISGIGLIITVIATATDW